MPYIIETEIEKYNTNKVQQSRQSLSTICLFTIKQSPLVAGLSIFKFEQLPESDAIPLIVGNKGDACAAKAWLLEGSRGLRTLRERGSGQDL